MLPKNRRIPRKMFPVLSKRAEIFKSELFLAKTAQGSGKSRFCFSVSKKIAKDAAIRNRMRRAGYRLLGSCIESVKPGRLVQFLFRRVPNNDKEIDESIKSILAKSNLTK